LSRRAMMELEEALNDPANQSGSTAWARASSDEALQDQLDFLEPGDRAYEAAARELARRDSARSEALQLKWIKRTLWVAIVLGVGGIGATLIT
jgi:hypothetical protein